MTENIELLTWREAVRKRPAMYVGNTGLFGIKILLKMIIQTVLFKTKCNRVEIEILNKLSGKLIFKNLDTSIKDSINEDLQLDASEFPILNALCSEYEFKLLDSSHKSLVEQIYQKGVLKKGTVKNTEYFAETLEINFTLDDTIWDFEKINFYVLNDEIRDFAFLCRDKIIVFKYSERQEQSRIVYNFENGLLDKLQIEKNWGDAKITNYSKKEFDDFSMELALGLSPFYYTEKIIASYVNFAETKDHGTHLIGLIKGIKKGLKAYLKKHFPDKKVLIKSSSIKKYLFAAIHIQTEKPIFWGPTRSRLQNHEIIKPISKYVAEIILQELEKEPKFTEDIIRHFEYV